MRVVLLAIVAAAATFAASAQDRPPAVLEGVEVQAAIPEEPFTPEWDRRPTGNDFARHYPSAALDRRVPGLAQLCCTPREDRTLDCRVGVAWPSEYPFDRASLAVAERFRMTPESYAAFQATPGAWLQLPIHWRHVSTGAEFDAIAAQIRERARGVCRPQPQTSQPAP